MNLMLLILLLSTLKSTSIITGNWTFTTLTDFTCKSGMEMGHLISFVTLCVTLYVDFFYLYIELWFIWLSTVLFHYTCNYLFYLWSRHFYSFSYFITFNTICWTTFKTFILTTSKTFRLILTCWNVRTDFTFVKVSYQPRLTNPRTNLNCWKDWFHPVKVSY